MEVLARLARDRVPRPPHTDAPTFSSNGARRARLEAWIADRAHLRSCGGGVFQEMLERGGVSRDFSRVIRPTYLVWRCYGGLP